MKVGKATERRFEKLVLEGERVRLEPVNTAHTEGLKAAIEDGELWKLPVTFVPHPSDLADFFADAEEAYESGRELAFTTIDKASGRVAGSTRFRCIDAVHARVEIGFTFLGASWQRTHINTEAKYLMLEHAFEAKGVNRVELLTDFLNQKSRNAIARIGAKEDGVLRSHMVMRDGRIRDSVLFSITRDEWPQAKLALQKKMATVSGKTI